MVEIRYSVHSVAHDDVDTEVTLADGSRAIAKVPSLTVEVLADNGLMSHILRFQGGDVAGAEALFDEDGSIVATFTAA